MNQPLTKKLIDTLEGEEGQCIRLRHGKTRLFLRIDRRTGKALKTFYFERELRNGKKCRMKVGDYPIWSLQRAEEEAKRLDVICDAGQDPRIVKDEVVADAKAKFNAKQAGKATLAEVWNAYLDAKAAQPRPLKPLTVRDYKKHIEHTFAQTADEPIRKLTRDWVLEQYPQLVQRVGVAQANQAMRSLRAVLNWALEEKRFAVALDGNPVSALKKKMRKVAPRKNCLERGQLGSWWVACEAEQNLVARAYLQFLLLTGARREEALSLQWGNVDLKWKTCTFCDTKNGDTRIIPLTDYVVQMLEHLPRINEWVFCSTSSATGRMQEPAKPIARIAAQTGLHISSHDLRRSFSTLAEWCELPDGAVKQILGHKPQGVTEEHYKPRPLDLLRMLMQKYETFILTEIRQQSTTAEVVPIKALAA